MLTGAFEDDRKVALFTELTYTLAPAAVDVPGQVDERGIRTSHFHSLSEYKNRQFYSHAVSLYFL